MSGGANKGWPIGGVNGKFRSALHDFEMPKVYEATVPRNYD